MLWNVLLLLFYCCSDVLSQGLLTQPLKLSVPHGGEARLLCTLSSDLENHSVGWYQDKMGQGVRFIYFGDNKRGEGIPDRFSGSRTGNKWYLTITGVQAEDEATYYCSTYYGAGSSFQNVFGGGTQLIVTGQPTVSPSVQVFAPSEQEIKSQKKATLVCLLSGFHPPAFTLKWKVDGTETTSGVETTKATKQGDKYLASSYLTRSDSDYGDHMYVCEVTHDGKTITKALTGSGSC